MGWNAGYKIYEQTVIAAYNSGSLTPESLQALIEPYAETDIDHGGCQDLRTKDGLSADEVVLKLLAPEFWKQYEAGDRAYHDDFHTTWMRVMRSW